MRVKTEKEIPKIINEIDKFGRFLYNYRMYSEVMIILNQLQESRQNLQMVKLFFQNKGV